MNLLFGSSENPFVCTDATGSDFSYRASKGEDLTWCEELNIFGKPVLEESAGSGFKRITQSVILVTLKDRDVHIWNYLEIRPRQNIANGMRQLFIGLVLLGSSFVLSQVLAFILGEFGYMSLSWYFRYPLFGAISFFLVLVLVIAYDEIMYECKLRKASRFIRDLCAESKSDISCYKDILEKIAMCNDQERSNTAKKLLERKLV